MIRVEDKILKAIEDLRRDMNLKFENQDNQLKEHTQILKALEHLAEVNKAEHDKMFFNMAEMSGEIKNIRKVLSNVELITASNWGDIVKLKSVK